jgi:spore coat-associated protein N
MRRLLTGIGAVLVAAALAAGSGASFQSTSANSGNIIKAGVVSVTSTEDGTAVLAVTGLAPGKAVFDTVDITNSGDLPFDLTLKSSSIADAPASPALSAKVDLKIEDVTAGTTAYDGKLGAFDSRALGSLAVGVKHTFKFTVSLADGGLGAENAYQGARTTLDLTWTAAG